MPGNRLGQRPPFIGRKAARAQRHALIQPYPVTHYGRLADDNAGAMIDEEAAPDRCPGMNVDTRTRMGNFGDDAGDQRRAQIIEAMGEPMMDDRQHRWIADQHLIHAARGGIAQKRRFHIGIEQLPQARQALGEIADDARCFAIDIGRRPAMHDIEKLKAYLTIEAAERRLQRLRYESIFIMDANEAGTKAQRKQRAA